ncbi:class I SAM-dependent DNA methyltransferase [Streptosporangium sp. NPDC001559]|uniref:class I SAM-dependent DNA methyltransferase n=1 Tax=Streptosporangium sp. NPDC001559 TaxID=3366187 RepID=UPI0036EEB5B4
MAQMFDPSAYGRAVADVYDGVYGTTIPDADTEAAVNRLAELADGGPVLEFGIGTGRLALPLAARGLVVAGVDGSAEMVRRLRAKPGGDRVPVTLGDFATTRVEGEFGLAVLAINTIFALPSQEAQVACFRNAAAHLRPGGRFVVEAWVPDPGAFRDGTALRLLSLSEERVLVEAARLSAADQMMYTTKVNLTSDGLRLLPANHRYAWPAELDLMGLLAGMEREHRWAGWDGSPYTDDSHSHVSVYRSAPGRP